ncbi:hypothetical protein AYO49_00145 [Verrucomicrobiaceae bacterium SCGC AG-212-N21]|nr:hypothetical protein AYO49_00145 [Verrucomicrobiaceae bacterium SCGC AG-212-N21]
MRFLFALGFLVCLCASARATNLKLAENGKALLPVVVASGADEQTRGVAKELATYLQRITSGEFVVQEGDGVRGIIIGTAAQFPDPAKAGDALTSKAITARENYLLRSEPERLLLIGNTPQAIEHAAWDLLNRLGYRQFFPGKTWEVVPQSPSLSIDVDTQEFPDYHARRIWFGFGSLEERTTDYLNWCKRNRATYGIDLRTGHAYDGIMHRNEGEFSKHPEYLALVDGVRKKPKFCISNPGLRKLVVQDALKQFEQNPEIDSVSCDPSDGGGWCQCADCAKLGSVTDRALLLANDVAEAIQMQHSGRMVGMYAYNEHSPPPSVEAHPQVVISVATSFIHGGFTIDQLLSGWQAKTRMLGIREYYSVNTWDRDLPGAARGGRLDYLRETIPHFHASGGRFMSAESSDNFGPNGLGYYLAARMLWDVKEAKNVEALTADFLDKAFGTARAPMAKFYALLDGSKRQALSDDLIGRMYRLLDEARGLAQDAAILARVNDLALYTRYVELYHDYASAQGKERQAAFEQVMRYAWRIRGTGMVHSKGFYRDLPNRDKSVTIAENAKYNVPEPKNPWKSSAPFTAEVIAGFIRDGITHRKLLDFEPVAFTTNLVPAKRLNLPVVPKGNAGIYLRGVRDFWTWIDQPPATISLTGKAGIIYDSRGMAKGELYPLAEAESKSVARFEIEPDKADKPIDLKTTFPGLHRIEVSDGGQGSLITWQDGTPMTVISSQEQPAKLYGRWHLYFYVPKGTKIIGGFSDGEGFLLNPAGKTVHTFENKPGYFSISVPPGEDGKLWSFKHSAGNRYLMTVPPCLARDASELLLPQEVVEKDAAR